MTAQLPQLAIDLRRCREGQRRLTRGKTIETINREIDRCLMLQWQTVDELLDRLAAPSIPVVDGLRARNPRLLVQMIWSPCIRPGLCESGGGRTVSREAP